MSVSAIGNEATTVASAPGAERSSASPFAFSAVTTHFATDCVSDPALRRGAQPDVVVRRQPEHAAHQVLGERVVVAPVSCTSVENGVMSVL